MTKITVDTKGLERELAKLSKKFGKSFNDKLKLALEKKGFDFLDLVQNNIIRKQVVDTRLLLNSFSKGSEGNIWTLTNGGLTLQVGTNVEYAQLVNDGHWTVRNKISGTLPDGTPYRWVPGVWQGNKFKYRKGAKTGMVLKKKWVEGRPYWDDAVTIFEQMFPTSFKQDLQRIVKELGAK